MNKWILRLASVLVVIGLLVGCASEEENPNNETGEEAEANQNSEQNEELASMTISQDNEEEIITEEEVVIEEDAILMDVLKENFDVEEEGGFIISIEGVSPEENEEKSWMFFVNGEMGSVGAEEFELTPGDEVTFDLQAWE
ncbi:hypothetical protein J2Z83_001747 [Virgibacillus natechei]|uniref:Transcobalamin-like C-terminal domain-containing protein n=1 Tax=Virgibacillus natechei TaxID=1216297 RepID=A0ABS4IFD1_9BACI|nr:DUF4430 domain-containing protein [Virgibacillus natechei]MBP1969640.1 hypothetical protein [Virgibacillus natechei]UZD11368.1 DUF4430 domain-containing protein [Virgibacillus natechei]